LFFKREDVHLDYSFYMNGGDSYDPAMNARPHLPTSTVVAVAFVSLAAAMGIGRFAFTPLMPLMQQASGVTLSEGTWLAMVNYAGYFVGAAATFLCARRESASVRWGLVCVAAATAAMAVTHAFPAWLALRFAAAVGSAFVLVGVSSWALAHLAANHGTRRAGAVFAGVGAGLMLAGSAALGAGVKAIDPAIVWLLLGVVAGLAGVAAWRPVGIGADIRDTSTPVKRDAGRPLDGAEWTLVLCYGVFGFGYILPATFIPAAARALVGDPAVFGWAWPIFGMAAALSTVVVSMVFRATPPRRIAVWSLVVMAAGVGAPLLRPGVGSLVVSALFVGSTFMVMTMAATQEARRIARGSPSRLIAALTAAFAIGQIAGPALVAVGQATPRAVTVASVLAVVLLLASAVILHGTRGRAARAAVV
jgi:hypothetical protein